MNVTDIVVACTNALWQGLALTAGTALLLFAVRRRNAASTCAVWSATFVAVAILPFVDLALARSADAPLPHTDTLASPLVDAAAAVTASFATRAGGAALLTWALVSLLLLFRLARDYAALLALKHSALPLARGLEQPTRSAGGRSVRICTSTVVRTPCVAGFLHPMVLVPAPLAETLGDEDLTRVVLHEIGHIARFDDWLNLGERILRAVFFFQPALWYAGSRIGFEREIACDDFAVAATGDPLRYAECLTNIVARHLRRGMASAPGLFLGRNQVLGRVVRLLDRRRDGSVHVPRFVPLGAAAVLLVALGGMLPLQLPVLSASHHARPALAHVRLRHVHAHPQVLAMLPVSRLVRRAPAPCPGRAAHAPQPPVRSAHVAEVALVHAPIAKMPTPVAPVHPRRHRIAHVRAHGRSPAHPRDIAPAGEEPGARDEAAEVAEAPDGDLLDALARAHMHATLDQLIELHDQGITGHFVDAIVGTGLQSPTVEGLVAARTQGIEPQMIASAVSAFGAGVSLRDIVGLRDAGVTPAYLDHLAPLRSEHLTVSDARALAEEGVTPAYIEGVMDAGYANLTASDVVRLHASGVDGDFLQQLARHGLRDVPVRNILRMHDEGVDNS